MPRILIQFDASGFEQILKNVESFLSLVELKKFKWRNFLTRFNAEPRLTVDFEHSLFGVISAGDKLVVGPTEELSPVPLPDAPDGHGEGHVAVIAEPRPLTQLPPIGPAPGNGVLTEIRKL